MSGHIEKISAREVHAGGFRTRYWEAGDPTAPPVVLLHDGAWGADGYVTWADVMADLAADYHVVAPDLLGFGGTDKVVFLDRPPYPFRIAHVGAFCRAIGLSDPAHFVGTSIGGSMVMRAAHVTDWEMASVTSIGGTGGPWRLEIGKQVLTELEPGRGYIERVVELLTNDITGFDDNIDRRLGNSLLSGHYGAMVALRLQHPAAPREVRIDDYPASLASARCPVTAVEMSRDRLMEPGWTAHVKAAARQVEVIHMDGPHCPNLTAPAATAEMLRGIFDRAA
ncbi:Pimeloyl-ACP methyl ester carboxylesterase [Modestobacter sp. DSM 44400]|uniref:alpha/beta fold hydrolase n=1 Tax=Modestobacter sp. DSM 44400 TaxID=1550230 RepID=UPI00089BCCED|nr:alpha/beta fold hydrolase [Modestobacter sp. DSM 44400]SDY74278.1 Pimeloyl-ACP methyl ester carboxylesterase [Modestobacter sp. DSM 44400]